MVPDIPWPSAGLLLAIFRSVANGKMGVEWFWKLECGELRNCFSGNEITTNGARRPLTFCWPALAFFSLGGQRENGRRIVPETRVW